MLQLSLFGPTKGERLIHIPTGRPVEVSWVGEREGEMAFSVVTLDDIWPHPKTGKPWGGCLWTLDIGSINEFRREVTHENT